MPVERKCLFEINRFFSISNQIKKLISIEKEIYSEMKIKFYPKTLSINYIPKLKSNRASDNKYT